MAPLDDKKLERTSAKRAVTVAANRLKTGCEYKMDSVDEMASKLDTAFCDFVEISTEYREMCTDEQASGDYLVVNGLDLDNYEQSVKVVYSEAISVYRSLVSSTHNSARSNPVSSDDNSDSGVHLKRRDPPKFSGLRKDWAEFKSIWVKIVVPSMPNKTALASELKLSCKDGPAFEEICNISAGSNGAYQKMWDALCCHYDNITLAVNCALDEIRELKPVKEEDYRGVVQLIRAIDSVYQQLDVLKQVKMVSSREVSQIMLNFPPLLRKDWAEFHSKLTSDDQLSPFEPLQKFLKEQLKMAKYLSDTQAASKFVKQSATNVTNKWSKVHKSSYSVDVKPKEKCCIHNTAGHTTAACRQFAVMSVKDRRDALMKSGLCFRCFGNHRRATCKISDPCELCGRKSHHTLMCTPKVAGDSVSSSVTSQSNSVSTAESSENASSQSSNIKTSSGNVTCNASRGDGGSVMTLYSIYEVPVVSSHAKATVFCDDGAESTFISETGIKKLKARQLGKTSVELSTLNGTESVETHMYEVILITTSGKKVAITAIGLPRLTGPVSLLDETVIADIFPDFDVRMLQRPTSSSVDLLLGGDYFGLHPKNEIASDGKNLSVMKGELGICVQGSHPCLKEYTQRDKQVGYAVRVVAAHRVSCRVTHPEFEPVIHRPVVQKSNDPDFVMCDGVFQCAVKETFVLGEQLGTEVTPKCGACKCGKCPVVGHSYSFQEEQELKLINSQLKYDAENQCWVAGYPWICDPKLLPNNYVAALATLRNTEKRLNLEPEWGDKYAEQIADMEERNVARKLTNEEMSEWNGPIFYLSHLAVEQPKSQTTPVRIVFNSSQVYKGVSLNSFLAKGPDSFKSNLLGLLLRFREESVVVVGDIRKMYNSVYLDEVGQHTHRFLWRDMELDRSPDIWCITRVNMGDKPAGSIAIEAKDRTADMFRQINPRAADFIVQSSYVDDLVDSFANEQEARCVADDSEKILAKGGFKVKCWDFVGKKVSGASTETKKVLGVCWVASDDVLVFKSQLNFSPKRRNVRTGPDLLPSEVPDLLPATLTRRLVLQQVMGVFDPYGILSPFMLQAKLLLRETWVGKLHWDEPLPPLLDRKWREFFTSLVEIDSLKYDRCITPEGAVGLPMLILLSDGSEVAYGCSAYIRWMLSDGSVWCRLLMAKSRVAPLNRISIPQMELNGAVLSKRCRKVIEKECRLQFEKILHFVDSETVLC